MLKTIKTIKTIKDAHSPVLKRAVCYNITRPTARAYKRKSGTRGSVQIPTAFMLDNGQGTPRKKSHNSKGEYTPQKVFQEREGFYRWKDRTQGNSSRAISVTM